MRIVERGALGGLPPQARDGGRGSGSDAPDRRVASGAAVLRLAAGDVSTQRGRSRRQSQAGSTADARDGDAVTGASGRGSKGRIARLQGSSREGPESAPSVISYQARNRVHRLLQ